MLDNEATLTFWQGSEAVRYVSGIVTGFAQGESGFSRTRYKMVIEPSLSRARYQSDNKIFQQQNSEKILRTLLQKNQVSQVDFSLTNADWVREYCVQYRETDLAFIERLAAEEGAYYYFEHQVSFEAGKLKDLLLSPVQQRRLTGIIGKHDSEWKKTRAADFIWTCGTYRDNNKEDSASRIEKRVEDLSIKLEVDGFNSDKQAYYLHPLGMIGWLAVSVGEFDWFETPLVKLILSKESKGSFNAYNITNKHGKPRESHFTPTAQYHISKMTITEIRNAQKN